MTYLLHDVHAAECAAKVDSTENNLCHERVLDSYGYEDGRTILYVEVRSERQSTSSVDLNATYVEEVVGAGELLEHLERHACGLSTHCDHRWKKVTYRAGCGRVACAGDGSSRPIQL